MNADELGPTPLTWRVHLRGEMLALRKVDPEAWGNILIKIYGGRDPLEAWMYFERDVVTTTHREKADAHLRVVKRELNRYHLRQERRETEDEILPPA